MIAHSQSTKRITRITELPLPRLVGVKEPTKNQQMLGDGEYKREMQDPVSAVFDTSHTDITRGASPQNAFV